MKIKVLIENTTDSDLQFEHGLSLYIEYKDKKILLDTGSTDAFAENAKQMGVDLAAVDMSFLSHGHYDHSGGYGAFIRENKSATVYAMEKAMERYASTSGGAMHEIGVPEKVKEVLRDRLVTIDKVTQIADGITLVPHSTPAAELRQIGERTGLYQESKGWHKECKFADVCEVVALDGGVDGRWLPDDFAHEMSLVLETEKGLVIFNSCSHGSLQNIIQEVKAALPGKKIYAYIGGLHMKGRKDGTEICTFTADEVKALTDYIKAEDIRILFTGHCTGAPATQMLRAELDAGRLHEMCSGKILEII